MNTRIEQIEKGFIDAMYFARVNEMKMSTQEIKNFLSTNQDNRKRVILHNIDDVLKVNSLLTEDDIMIIVKDSSFYDGLYDHEYPFVDLLDDFYMSHLDIESNSNDVMCWLHYIYA